MQLILFVDGFAVIVRLLDALNIFRGWLRIDPGWRDALGFAITAVVFRFVVELEASRLVRHEVQMNFAQVRLWG
jgi:hypothetical protein